MATVGIDIGSHFAKAVLLNQTGVISKSAFKITTDPISAADRLIDELMAGADFKISQADLKAVTGVGGQAVSKDLKFFPELLCHGKGAHYYFSSARSVISIGAESFSVGRLDDKGGLVDFGSNDKCAAGSGIFIEEMAKALRIDIPEIGELAAQSTQDINMSSTCSVFAESEVVSMVHKKIPKADISRAILKSLVTRIISLAKRVGIENDVVVVGGAAKNIGIIKLLEETLGDSIKVPDEPDITAALGAAILAQG